MRWIALIASLSLGGCASILDAANKVGSNLTDLQSAFSADIELEAALLRDTAVMSEQLSYITLGEVTCGDPADDYVRWATTYPYTDKQRDSAQKRWKEKQNDIEKKFRARFAALDVVISYAESLAAVIKSSADRQSSMTKLAAAIDAYKKFATGEIGLALNGVGDIVGLIQAVESAAESATLIRIARVMEKPLDEADKAITTGNILKAMTADEVRAFTVWDACAHERLRFIRDYNPRLLAPPKSRATKSPPPYLSTQLAGEAPTPNLHLAKEYKAYLDQREAFLAKRPDYVGLVHAIVAANSAIAHPKPGQEPDAVFDALTALGKLADQLSTATEKVRTDLKKVGA